MRVDILKKTMTRQRPVDPKRGLSHSFDTMTKEHWLLVLHRIGSIWERVKILSPLTGIRFQNATCGTFCEKLCLVTIYSFSFFSGKCYQPFATCDCCSKIMHVAAGENVSKAVYRNQGPHFLHTLNNLTLQNQSASARRLQGLDGQSRRCDAITPRFETPSWIPRATVISLLVSAAYHK